MVNTLWQRCGIFTFAFFCYILSASPSIVAAANYGADTYGGGDYGVGVVPAPVPAPAASVGSSSGGGWTARSPTPPSGGFTAVAGVTDRSGKTILQFGFGADIKTIAISDNIKFAPATYINATTSMPWTATSTTALFVKYCNQFSKCSTAISVPIIHPPSQTSPAYIFSTPLGFGMKNDSVTQLQKFLASDSSVYPEALITGYFGILTKNAVKRFQLKWAFVSPETPESSGYGFVGPRTRAKLNELSATMGTHS